MSEHLGNIQNFKRNDKIEREDEMMAKITINEALCKGCGMCVNACPKNLLVLATDHINAKGYHPATITDMAQCVGCTSCAIMCPDVVITVEK